MEEGKLVQVHEFLSSSIMVVNQSNNPAPAGSNGAAALLSAAAVAVNPTDAVMK